MSFLQYLTEIRRPPEVFFEIYREDYILIAVFRYDISGGHWTGYAGHRDGVPIDDTAPFPNEVTGTISTEVVPQLGISILLKGFDTMHAGDINIRPDGSAGWNMSGISDRPEHNHVWNHDLVFAQLRRIADFDANMRHISNNE